MKTENPTIRTQAVRKAIAARNTWNILANRAQEALENPTHENIQQVEDHFESGMIAGHQFNAFFFMDEEVYLSFPEWAVEIIDPCVNRFLEIGEFQTLEQLAKDCKAAAAAFSAVVEILTKF